MWRFSRSFQVMAVGTQISICTYKSSCSTSIFLEVVKSPERRIYCYSETRLKSTDFSILQPRTNLYLTFKGIGISEYLADI